MKLSYLLKTNTKKAMEYDYMFWDLRYKKELYYIEKMMLWKVRDNQKLQIKQIFFNTLLINYTKFNKLITGRSG